MRKSHSPRTAGESSPSFASEADEGARLEKTREGKPIQKSEAAREDAFSAGDEAAEHYGSRAETNAALEGKIALQNTRQLRHPRG